MNFSKKKYFLSLFLGITASISNALAHDIPTEAFDFILNNPEASFEEFLQVVEDDEQKEYFEQNPIETALELPGKKNIGRELLLLSSPTEEVVQPLIEEDPILSELGAEAISVFLQERIESQSEVAESPSLTKFIWLGFIHIIQGLDHVLFVLALILLLPPFRRLIIILSTFTIAHSLTFLLGGTEVLSLSSSIVEPIIALSIAVMALLSFWQKSENQLSTWKLVSLVFVFGLFHGLGFAGVFEAYAPDKSTLLTGVLGFNLGVEIGQIVIVLLCYPLLALLYKTKHKTNIQRSIAVMLFFAGLYWFLTRI